MASEKRFAEIKKLLESNNWKLIRINGSHHIFAHPNASSAVIPVHNNKVQPAYVRYVEKKIREANQADAEAKD